MSSCFSDMFDEIIQLKMHTPESLKGCTPGGYKIKGRGSFDRVRDRWYEGNTYRDATVKTVV